jgi:hypothetical protein
MEAVLSQRVRHFEIIDMREKGGKVLTADEQAKSPLYGYELGRLLKQGKITRTQFDAGEKFGTDMANHYHLSGQQFPSARAQNLFAAKGISVAPDSEKRAKQARDAKWRAMRLMGLLRAVGDIETGRKVCAVTVAVCVGDHELTKSADRHFHIRRGLNALTAFYGLDT